MTTYKSPRGYCSACRSNTSRDHASTARHRRSTASRETGIWLRSRAGGAVRPWMNAIRGDDEESAYDLVTTYPAVWASDEEVIFWA